MYCRTKAFLDQKSAVEPSDQEVMLFALGYGLQDVLTPPIAEAPIYEQDGIVYRPDMVFKLPASEVEILTELKTTRKSAKYHFMEDSLPETWLDYMKGGCYLRKTSRYDLVILYMMGDYHPPFPDIYAETDEFTDEEIQENWQKILARKVVLDDSLSTNTPPEPFKNCYDWECKYCRYQLVCQTLARQMATKMSQEQAEEDQKLWQ